VPYSQNPPKYDAHQWTSGMTADDFSALVDPGGVVTWSINTDGSLHFTQGGFLFGDIPLNNWIVSISYWSTSLTWDLSRTITLSPSGSLSFTDTEFNQQFTATT